MMNVIFSEWVLLQVAGPKFPNVIFFPNGDPKQKILIISIYKSVAGSLNVGALAHGDRFLELLKSQS